MGPGYTLGSLTLPAALFWVHPWQSPTVLVAVHKELDWFVSKLLRSTPVLLVHHGVFSGISHLVLAFQSTVTPGRSCFLFPTLLWFPTAPTRRPEDML